jgi:hypothetical protein
VVIAGMARSGTQLTRRLLGSHSAIAVPTREFKVRDVLDGRIDVAGFLDRLPLDDWGVPWRDLRTAPVGEAYRELLIRCATTVGKPVGGEKSPGNEHCVEEMGRWFGADRLVVVHLVRDPLDRLASLVRAPFRTAHPIEVDATAEARAWCDSVRLGLRRSAADPEHYRLVRYEDLARGPERVARDLFGLIGVHFEAEALTLHAYVAGDNTSFPRPAGPDGAAEGPPIRFPGSRADTLDPRDVDTVTAIAGDLAREMGYRSDRA